MRVRGALALLIVLSVASCTPPPGSGGGVVPGDTDVLVAEVTRLPAEVESARRAAAALEALASDLYREVAKDDGNVVFSPYSIAVALAMSRAGAAGETARQMDQVLHSSLAGDLHAAYNALDQLVQGRAGTYPRPGLDPLTLELRTANQLWGQQNFVFEAAFLETLARYYGAGMRLVDFRTEVAAARAAINEWVKERTADRIPELIPNNVLDQDTRLVLTNAVYLKAQWTAPFPVSATRTEAFLRLDGTPVQVAMMHEGSSRAYVEGNDYRAVRLPYGGGLSMIVLVPDEGRFEAFESALTEPGRLRSIVDSMSFRHVNLGLPKFEFRTKAPLKPVLETLGMPIAFTEEADFSRITLEDRLLIQDVIHEAFIAVDESGTEAAAATAVGFGITSGPRDPVDLTVDRPFLFVIRDDETGATLFMGRVVDPSR